LTEFAIEHVLMFMVISLRMICIADPSWLSILKQRNRHQEEQTDLNISKIKRFELVHKFVKKQIADRFSTN